jgi:hypothetical protein
MMARATELFFAYFILMSLVFSSRQTNAANTVTKEEIKVTLEHLWKSLDSTHFISEEYNVSADGQPDTSKGFTRYDVVVASGGKRKFKSVAVWPDREEIGQEFWEDGKNHFQFTRLKKHSDIIDNIVITPQASTDENYVGSMCLTMWILTPGGHPLYLLVNEGSLKQNPGQQEEGLYDVEAEHRGTKLTCTLDSKHDWLPSKITLANAMEIVIDEFKQANGRWYPAAGTQIRLRDKRAQKFINSTFEFNRHDKEFNPIPRLPKGAVAVNAITGAGQFVGGKTAREEFTKKYVGESAHANSPVPPAHRHINQSNKMLYFFAAIGLFMAGAIVRWYLRRLGQTNH